MNKLVRKAFTLIELLVVIAIIGILSGLIVVSMGGMTQKATIAKSQVFSNSLRNSLMMNIVSEWKLDGNGKDSWGSNDCTLNAATSSNDCVQGSCYSFSGSASYASCGSVSSLSSGTVLVWIKPSGTYTASQVIMGASSGGADVSGRYNLGAIHSTVCSSSWYTDIANGTTAQYACSGEVYNSTNFPANQWVLLVVTYDGSNIKFYKNGMLINTVAQTVSGAGDAQMFSIGRIGTYNGFYYYGSIDEVRIFNAAIPISQIKQQYYVGLNNLLMNGGIDAKEYSEKINLIAQR